MHWDLAPENNFGKIKLGHILCIFRMMSHSFQQKILPIWKGAHTDFKRMMPVQWQTWHQQCYNFRERCKKCAILRKHNSEHNLSLITAAAPFIAYINNWSHNNLSRWAIIDNISIRSVLDHKRGPVIRHSVRWLGASANMYLMEHKNIQSHILTCEWIRWKVLMCGIVMND